MTSATTILALLPVLTSTGRGSDIMVPMAIPSFGGMLIQMITMLVVPVLYSAVKELQFHTKVGQFGFQFGQHPAGRQIVFGTRPLGKAERGGASHHHHAQPHAHPHPLDHVFGTKLFTMGGGLLCFHLFVM